MGDFEAKKGFVRLDGKEWPIMKNLADNWDLAELIAEAEQGSAVASIAVAKLVLSDSDEAYEAMKREATVDGRVSTEKMQTLIADVITRSANPN